jgi:hypothetical protein
VNKKRTWTSVIAAVTAIMCWLTLRNVPEFPLQSANWSAAPLFVSIASFSFLLVRAFLSRAEALQSASTASYLISGPSAGSSFLLQYLVPSMTAPLWVMWTQAVLFFGSAGLYYLGYDHSEDESPSRKVVRTFSNV